MLGLEADLLHQRHRALPDLLRVFAQDMDGRHHHVIERGLVRKEVVLLEHHRDFLAQRDPLGVGLERVHLVVGYADRALLDRHQAIDAPKQRRLARPRRADDANDASLGHAERDALDDLRGAEGLVDVAELDDRLRHALVDGRVHWRTA
jgi:hypothetical protein